MADTTQTQGEWGEPETPYGKVKGVETDNMYPYNKVYESESGHVIQVDDTPGSERLDVFHRSGTFEEIHPNGDRVTKVVRDRYTSILRDDYLHIDGFCDVTIDKALKIIVNKDNIENTPSKNVNFDIEVGKNSNVNLVIRKGNCNVKLEDGDVNLLMNRGDVNIKQEKGNYNHFVNGDYNLEVTGKMHVVVGKDVVNEIGGNRDIRVDGAFDNKWITKGYSETLVENGDMRIEVGKNHHQLIHGDSHLKIEKGRRTFISDYEELSVSGPTKIKVAPGDLDIFIDGSTNISGSQSLDGSFSSYIKLNTDSNLDILSKSQTKITSLSTIDMLSRGSMKLTSNGAMDILGSGIFKITSGGIMGIKAGGALLQTGRVIHLNGPGAPSASTASQAQQARPADLPDKPFIYVPGEMGSWTKTVNGKTPASVMTGAVDNLNGQLGALDSAKGQLSGAGDQLGALQGQMAAGNLDATQLSSVANGAAGVTNNVSGINGVVNSVVGAVGGVVDGVIGAAGGLVTGLGDALGKFGSGGDLLSSLKNGIGGIAGFIGDIFSTITDIACGIIDGIGSLLGAVGSLINDAINSVLNAIGSVINAIGSVIDSVAKIIGDIIGGITDIIGKVFDAAGNFIGGIIDGIGSIIDSIAGIFGGLAKPSNCGISLALCTGDTAVGLAVAPPNVNIPRIGG